MVYAIERSRMVKAHEDCRLPVIKTFVDVVRDLQQRGFRRVVLALGRLHRIEAR